MEQETVWKKNKDGHDVIITYKLGEKNTKSSSTARVKLKLAPTPYACGYAYKFDGKAYRSIHGSSVGTDIMFYYPEEIVGKVAADFKALVTYQPPYLDQGYYNVDMVCESRTASLRWE